MFLNCGSDCRHGWVLEVNDTIILHNVLSYPKTRPKRIIVCFFVCATTAGAREMTRHCMSSSHMPLLLRHRRSPGLSAVTRPGPSQASSLTATLRISPSFLQGASRTQSGCSQINTFSRCITPSWKCPKIACTLTSMHQPMRTAAPSSP